MRGYRRQSSGSWGQGGVGSFRGGRPLEHTCSCCGGAVEWPNSNSCGRCEGNRFLGECYRRGYDPKTSTLTPLQWLQREFDELARLRAAGDGGSSS